jgi:iron complex outermembrane receptor protein
MNLPYSARLRVSALLLLAPCLLPTAGMAQSSVVENDETVILSPFEVSGESKGYMATNTISGTAMNTPLRDVPMTINVITSELIDDLDAIDLQDILAMNSSITQTSRLPISNRNAAWSIRGFRNRNVLVDGVTAGDFIPPQLIDRVEVVKGPNTLYGQSDPGGLVNIITKRPLANNKVVGSSFFGNNGRLGGDLDANMRLAQDAVGLRVLTGYNQTDGYRKVDGDESKYLALVGDFKVTANTTLLLSSNIVDSFGVPSQRSTYSFEIVPTDLNGDGAITNTVVSGVNERSARYNSTFLPRDYTSATEANQFDSVNWYLGLGARHVFNEHVSTQYNFVRSHQRMNMTFREFNQFNAVGTSDVNHTASFNKNRTAAHTLQTAITFDTGPVSHRILVGGRSTEDYGRSLGYSLRALGPGNERTILDGLIASGRNIRKFLTKSDVLSGVQFWLDDQPTETELITLGTRNGNVLYSQTDVDSGYVTDSMGFMDDRLKVLAGVRYVDITSFSVDYNNAVNGAVNKRADTSYQLGVVYNLTQNISVFGNTATAFNPNGLDSLTGLFREPEESTAFEFGFKFDNLWNDRIGGSVAFFNIEKINVVRSDYNPITFSNITEVSNDEARGIDVELFFNLTKSWQIMAGYSYLDAEVVKSQTSALGLGLEGAAPVKLTLWTSYEMESGPMKGLRFGGGLVHTNGPIQQFGTSSSRLVVEDGYTDINLFARYQVEIAERPITLGLNVSNLTDTFYIQSRAGTNNPRQITFSSSMEF